MIKLVFCELCDFSAIFIENLGFVTVCGSFMFFVKESFSCHFMCLLRLI